MNSRDASMPVLLVSRTCQLNRDAIARDLMRLPADVMPGEVGELLRSQSPAERDDAWTRLVAAHSRLILRVTHSALQHQIGRASCRERV